MNNILPIILFATFITTAASAQQAVKYLIIDRKLKHPIEYANAISNEQIKNGYFAVEMQNVDPLVSKLDSLRKRLRTVARENYDQKTIDIGATSLTITVTKLTVADRLNVALSTDTGNGHDIKFSIVDGRLTNNDNARYLARLIKYIKAAQ